MIAIKEAKRAIMDHQDYLESRLKLYKQYLEAVKQGGTEVYVQSASAVLLGWQPARFAVCALLFLPVTYKSACFLRGFVYARLMLVFSRRQV